MAIDVSQMRDATARPRKVWLVHPNGRIVTSYYGPGLPGTIVDLHGELLPERKTEGWVTLREAYANDADLGEHGFEVFREAQRHRQRLGDEWLPLLVVERRKAARERKTWAPPAAPKRKAAPMRDDDPPHEGAE